MNWEMGERQIAFI